MLLFSCRRLPDDPNGDRLSNIWVALWSLVRQR